MESLPCTSNQSGAIVCGGGQLSVEVIVVPKRLNDDNAHSMKKVTDGCKKEYCYPQLKQCSNLMNGAQVMSTQEKRPVIKMVNIEGITLWSPNDSTIVLNHSNTETKTSTYAFKSQINDMKIGQVR